MSEQQHAPNENEGNENKTANEIQTEVTRSKRQIKLPENLLDYELYQAYCLTTMEEEEPQTYQEAIRKGWKDAIDKELEAHEIMRTWTVSDIPENTKIIDAKWIFKLKENGVRKARLVARGYQLKDDLFTNNYAPVARISTVRTLLVESIQKSWKLKQLDITTAFLNGELDTAIYIKAPEGINLEEKKVLKLNKGLYGLRESPKCWNKRFNNFMLKNNFERSLNDFCLYKSNKLWLLIYVDDIILTGEESSLNEFLVILQKEFQMKDFGEPSTFLGMEIEKKNETLKITQRRQINRMLQKYSLSECNGQNLHYQKVSKQIQLKTYVRIFPIGN